MRFLKVFFCLTLLSLPLGVLAQDESSANWADTTTWLISKMQSEAGTEFEGTDDGNLLIKYNDIRRYTSIRIEGKTLTYHLNLKLEEVQYTGDSTIHRYKAIQKTCRVPLNKLSILVEISTYKRGTYMVNFDVAGGEPLIEVDGRFHTIVTGSTADENQDVTGDAKSETGGGIAFKSGVVASRFSRALRHAIILASKDEKHEPF